MDYKITVRVEALEKVIDIDWKDIEHDLTMFIRKLIEPEEREERESYMRVFRVVTSRIKNVFLDRCKNSLIQ